MKYVTMPTAEHAVDRLCNAPHPDFITDEDRAAVERLAQAWTDVLGGLFHLEKVPAMKVPGMPGVNTRIAALVTQADQLRSDIAVLANQIAGLLLEHAEDEARKAGPEPQPYEGGAWGWL